MIGGSGGGYFNDKLPDADLYNPDWRISHIRVRDGRDIDGIQIYQKNEKARYKKSLPYHGGTGGESKYEKIDPNECIHGVQVNFEEDRIRGLLFYITDGNKRRTVPFG